MMIFLLNEEMGSPLPSHYIGQSIAEIIGEAVLRVRGFNVD
jgi:hypothetical protein